MRILVTNDDGVDAPGLLALKRALDALGETLVVAPEHNWSAAGHRKTMHKPLRVEKRTLRDGSMAYATDGAPTDFCLADARGSVMFDLMKPGVLRRIARMIEARFAGADDRLAAVGF
jgi:5'/3'-nucleotidase SurE